MAWFEVHSENYFAEGGPALAALDRIRADYPLSLHGVGLSLGSTDPLARPHLDKLAQLIARVEPALVSEHLCWSGVAGRHFNDLLPLPFTGEALAHVCSRVEEVQDYLGRRDRRRECLGVRRLRRLDHARMGVRRRRRAADRLQAAARRQQCLRQRREPRLRRRHLSRRDAAGTPIAEIHLAGFDATGPCLIDTHCARVAPEVWALYRRTIARIGPRPTLIEWDVDIPEFAVLEAEAATASAMLADRHAVAA